MNPNLRKSLAAVLIALPIFASAEHTIPAKPDILKIVAADAEKIFGEARGEFGQPDSVISTTIPNFVTIRSRVTEDVSEIDKNIYFMPGCRPGKCDEKGAVIVDVHNEKLLAAALRHFNCKATTPKRKLSRCDKEPSVVIYLINDPKNSSAAGVREKHLEVLKSWAIEWGPYRIESVVDFRRK